MSAIDHIMDERDSLRRELQRLEVSITKVMLEREELRHLSRQLETMNEAVIDCGRAVGAQRDEFRDVIAKIYAAATVTTGVPDRDKLVGIAQECRKALDGSEE